MNGRNRRGIVISVIVSAVLAVGNTGIAFADAELFDGNEAIGSEVSQDIVQDTDGDWVLENIEEPQDLDEEYETDENLQEGNEEEKADVNREHHHDAFCGYRDALPEIPCDHDCLDTDGDGIIDHCPECAYRPAVEAVPCKYELEKLKAEEELKKQQELEEQQENKDSEQQETEEKSGMEGSEQENSEVEESGKTDGQIIKKEDESGTEKSGENQKDSLSGMTNQGQKNDNSKTEEEAHEVTSPQMEGQENISEKANVTEETAENSEGSSGESTNDIKDVYNTMEAPETGEKSLPSNEPVYEVEIPSQVRLTDDTDSFTIQTKKLIPEEDGELVVTVEGTESKDRKNFALYCGENSWEYRLEIAGNLITPEENQVILDGLSEVHKMNILPEENVDLCAGEYSGVLMFHVVYERKVENYEMKFN